MKDNIREYKSPHMNVVCFDSADIIASSPTENEQGICNGIRDSEFGVGLRF